MSKLVECVYLSGLGWKNRNDAHYSMLSIFYPTVRYATMSAYISRVLCSKSVTVVIICCTNMHAGPGGEGDGSVEGC